MLPGAPLALLNGTPLNSTFTSVPVGYGGAGTDGGAALVANAGKYNLNLADTAQLGGGGNRSLLGATEIKSTTATIRRSFTSRIDAFLDVGVMNNFSTSVMNGAVLPFTIPGRRPDLTRSSRIFRSPRQHSAQIWKYVQSSRRGASALAWWSRFLWIGGSPWITRGTALRSSVSRQIRSR
ncbi:MAG: hypothetical protein WDO56_11530 [Gammaproteobacteria bacterium]